MGNNLSDDKHRTVGNYMGSNGSVKVFLEEKDYDHGRQKDYDPRLLFNLERFLAVIINQTGS